MTDYFVTRHTGAVEWAVDWAKRTEITFEFVKEFDPSTVLPGDRVYGTLPVDLAALVCSAGGRYFHLVFPQTVDMRGNEHSREAMIARGARLVEYRVAEFEAGN